MSQHGCPERLSNRAKGFQEDAGSATMEVLVETLTGTAFEMTVSPSDTVFAIKSKICRVEGIPVSQQHLVFGSRELEDGCSLGAAGVRGGARLRLVLGLRGGPVSTRRLPPPRLAPEPWRDIECLLHSNSREEGEWGGGCGGAGCRVTVVVFRDGERVNMLRVHENADGTLSAPGHCRYSPPPSEASASGPSEGSGDEQNHVTASKMSDLRRRMGALALQRHRHRGEGEIQKTRSEESLSVCGGGGRSSPGLLARGGLAPLLGSYTRLDCDCECDCLDIDSYTLLPPIDDAADKLKLSEALAGSILVAGGRGRDEPCLEGEEPRLRPRSPPLAPDVPAAEYGPLVGGGSGGGSLWRRRAAASQHARSASSLHAPAPPPAPLSASTSDLRRSRLLPALSRHRNTTHLHLSELVLHRAPPAPAPPPPPAPYAEKPRVCRWSEPAAMEPPAGTLPEKKARVRCGLCRKRLTIATVHTCRCGDSFCAPHRYAEVHGCAYDYKRPLRPPSPLLSHRLPKI